LVETVKKCFLKKLSVLPALIKVAVLVVNYQKEQRIYKEVYFILSINFLIVIIIIIIIINILLLF